MRDDKPLPVARGTLPDGDRFTVADALYLTAEAAHPGAWGGDLMAPRLHAVVTRDMHRRALEDAIAAGRVQVFDPNGMQPFPPLTGERLDPAIIMRDDLQRFAREWLRIELVREAAEATKAAPTLADEPAGGDWHSAAREQAQRILRRDRDRDLFPSVVNIADEIAQDWRGRGVVGAKGAALSAATIKRHALKGITLDAPAGRATQRNRGK